MLVVARSLQIENTTPWRMIKSRAMDGPYDQRTIGLQEANTKKMKRRQGMKKIIITAILVVGLAAGYAVAHNSDWGMRGNGGHMMGGGQYGMMHHGMMRGGQSMMGPGMMGGAGGYMDCPGARSFGNGRWTGEPQQQFLDDTVELRKELHDKYFAYQEARRNPGTTQDQLVSIEKEIVDLRSQLQERAQR